MEPVFTTSLLLVIFFSIGLAGFVTGVTGFGFAVIGTGLLAALLPPQTAIVLMLIPMFAATGSLVGELDRAGVVECAHRFWVFFVAILCGTIIGMAVLDSVPTAPLSVALGVFILGYVIVLQEQVEIPGDMWIRGALSTPGTYGEAGIGVVSGIIFGATNVGVQVVAYVQALKLDHSTFVGVLAMIFVGLTTIRIGIAAGLGYYGDPTLLLISLTAVVPSVLAVRLGQLVRPRISESQMRIGIVLLLALIGVRLILAGVMP